MNIGERGHDLSSHLSTGNEKTENSHWNRVPLAVQTFYRSANPIRCYAVQKPAIYVLSTSIMLKISIKMKINIKVNLSLCSTKHQPMKTCWRSGGILPLILNIGTGCRWVVSFTPRPLYTRRKTR